MNDQQPTATVLRITPVGYAEVVALDWEGRTYRWQTEPGKYSVRQVVPIVPPSNPGDNIRPAE